MSVFHINLDDTLSTRPAEDVRSLFQQDAYRTVGVYLSGIARGLDREEREQRGRLDLVRSRSHETIFVSGGRGSGKTTFVMNIADYFTDTPGAGPDDAHIAATFKFLPSLDPTLIENWEPFIACVVGHILNHAQLSDADTSEGVFRHQKGSPHQSDAREDLFQALDSVTDSLRGVQQAKDAKGYEQVAHHQASLRLAENLHAFFRAASRVHGRKALVLPIDDIDMAAQRGFEVLEAIRLYLASPYVVLIVTGDRQLYDHIVFSTFREKLSAQRTFTGNELDFEGTVRRLSFAYLEKIFPAHLRIGLRDFADLSEKHDFIFDFGVTYASSQRFMHCDLLVSVLERLVAGGFFSRTHFNRMNAIIGSGSLRSALQFFVAHRKQLEDIRATILSWLRLTSVQEIKTRIDADPAVLLLLKQQPGYSVKAFQDELQGLLTSMNEVKEEDGTLMRRRRTPLVTTAVAANLLFPQNDRDGNRIGVYVRPIAEFLEARGFDDSVGSGGITDVLRTAACVRGDCYLTRLAVTDGLRRAKREHPEIFLTHGREAGGIHECAAYFCAALSHEAGNAQPLAFPARLLYTLFAGFDREGSAAAMADRLWRDLHEELPGQWRGPGVPGARSMATNMAPISLDAVNSFIRGPGQPLARRVWQWQQETPQPYSFLTPPQLDLVIGYVLDVCQRTFEDLAGSAQGSMPLGRLVADIFEAAINALEAIAPVPVGPRMSDSLAGRLSKHPLRQLAHEHRGEIDRIVLSRGYLLDVIYERLASIRMVEIGPNQFDVRSIENDADEFRESLLKDRSRLSKPQLDALRLRIEDARGRAYRVLARLHDRNLWDVIRGIGEALETDPDAFVNAFAPKR